jgi:hypothetical protein
MMGYFIITGEEDGIQINFLLNKVDVIKRLEAYYSGQEIVFLDRIPSDMHELHLMDKKRVVLIKGDIVVPKAIEVVKQYSIE